MYYLTSTLQGFLKIFFNTIAEVLPGWCPNFVITTLLAAKAAYESGIYDTAGAVPFQGETNPSKPRESLKAKRFIQGKEHSV